MSGNWDRAWGYADALETFARKEPTPWSEFYVSRGRALARSGQGSRVADLRDEIVALHCRATDVGLRAGFVEIEDAKVELLLTRLIEVVEEGHKALVFSQFTKLLGIVREQLDAVGIEFAYLDGRTRKRHEKVKQFQESADCKVFLISLKAGGLGLNLTAAEYVFLLDPWWNPASENQAIDRAHRIGQTKKVVAYRLITKNTVEEKVLELQDEKRELAASILGGREGLLRNLAREDLELLLS